jgi:malic enzyme
VVLAGLLNGLRLQGTALEDVVLVVLGAGSSAIGEWDCEYVLHVHSSSSCLIIQETLP